MKKFNNSLYEGYIAIQQYWLRISFLPILFVASNGLFFSSDFTSKKNIYSTVFYNQLFLNKKTIDFGFNKDKPAEVNYFHKFPYNSFITIVNQLTNQLSIFNLDILSNVRISKLSSAFNFNSPPNNKLIHNVNILCLWCGCKYVNVNTIKINQYSITKNKHNLPLKLEVLSIKAYVLERIKVRPPPT